MNQSIIDISQTLSKYFVDMNKNEYSVFLCGGSSSSDAIFRKKLGVEINNKKSRYQYNVYMPENIFLEFIMGYKKYDSLSLENILAKSVNSIVIPLQSPGTFTELGAFSNHIELQNKLIIIVDPKFKAGKSFINTGPISFLKNNTKSAIIYSKCDTNEIKNLANDICDITRELAKHNKVENSLQNPLSAFNFYLSLIYIFEPISKKQIELIIKQIDSTADALIVCDTVLNSLVTQRKVIMNVKDEYSIVKNVLSEMYNLYTTKRMTTEVIDFLTTHRLKALNIILRRKTYKKWGEDQALRQP